jgi:hypothetical protein
MVPGVSSRETCALAGKVPAIRKGSRELGGGTKNLSNPTQPP